MNAPTPSVYVRGALPLAVSGGGKLDTMPQEGSLMGRAWPHVSLRKLGPGAKYADAVASFFSQHPTL